MTISRSIFKTKITITDIENKGKYTEKNGYPIKNIINNQKYFKYIKIRGK